MPGLLLGGIGIVVILVGGYVLRAISTEPLSKATVSPSEPEGAGDSDSPSTALTQLPLIEDRSIRSSVQEDRLPKVESDDNPAANPTDQPALTVEMEKQFLRRARESYEDHVANFAIGSNAGPELAFVTRCVATVLRAHGRADYGNPAELAAQGGFKLRSPKGMWTFAADRAKFTFEKGEFLAYDLAMSRLNASSKGGIVLPLTQEQFLQYEGLYDEALVLLDSKQQTPAKHGPNSR